MDLIHYLLEPYYRETTEQEPFPFIKAQPHPTTNPLTKVRPEAKFSGESGGLFLPVKELKK